MNIHIEGQQVTCVMSLEEFSQYIIKQSITPPPVKNKPWSLKKRKYKTIKTCEECDREFRGNKALANHITRTHNSTPQTCPKCGKVTKDKVSMGSHIAMHRRQAGSEGRGFITTPL